MKIIRSGSQPSSRAPAENFSGMARRDPLFMSEPPGRVQTGMVTFEPCARTDWHTHPLGQILVVTCGCGWVQAEGTAKQVIRAGDVVWTPPNTRHWHGATATTAMSHIAITESLNGKAVDWLEKVTDEQYMAAAAD